MTTGSRKTAVALTGLAAVAALTLTACNDDGSGSGTTTAPSSAAASSPAASKPTGMPTSMPSKVTIPGAPSGDASSPAGGGGGATAGPAATAGQTFKIGQPATIPFSYGSTKGTIALTVTSIDAGVPSDLAPLNLGDKVKGMVPYYVRFSVTNVGNSDLSFTNVSEIKGLLPDGSEAQGVSIFSDFPKCNDNALPSGFTKGKSVQGCILALAPTASVKVDGAMYWGDPYTLDKGVYWK
ncbi:hypothetical protein E6W39_08740 [Kitasatospora acidiphila]|uniref:DUF4352 domain-containing protein n=1 Tax=Kitasatospora acidiphila TaxID=2567942 RepID=A0A540W005_9ACTN|nr:hypothetical protein [Kitasatospora acidiphila]TQF02348.1 hypothetical protein E6W39_08740 [Kitasatospora acidiphila]